MNTNPRPIQSDLKSYRIHPEAEKPARWSFLKILREFSTIKAFYPEINPYAEVYHYKENLYCIFTEGLQRGIGDMWSYLIEGPKKAMLIDTGLGAGNLKALCNKLVNGKEIIVVNTHKHLDHIGGNLWFDTVYCHEYDKEAIIQSMTPTFISSFLLDEHGNPRDSYFDINDLPPFHPYEVIGVQDGYYFDLGDNYQIELIHLPGHTAGQCGFLDHTTGAIYIGDMTSTFDAAAKEKHPECCTIQAMHDALLNLQSRFDIITGVYPGHGTFDMHVCSLQYLLDTTKRVLEHPEQWDSKKTMDAGDHEIPVFAKFIYQWGSDLKYTKSSVR